MYYNAIDTENMKAPAPAPESRPTYIDTAQQFVRPMCTCLWLIGIVVLWVMIIFGFLILLGILVVLLNTAFEFIIVSLFGRSVFDKNFPVCTNTVYTGRNCYASTSTYCT